MTTNKAQIDYNYNGFHVLIETDVSQLEYANAQVREVFGEPEPTQLAGSRPPAPPADEIDITLTPEEVAFIIERITELAGPEPVDKVKLSLSEDSPTLVLTRHKEPTPTQGPTLVED